MPGLSHCQQILFPRLICHRRLGCVFLTFTYPGEQKKRGTKYGILIIFSAARFLRAAFRSPSLDSGPPGALNKGTSALRTGGDRFTRFLAHISRTRSRILPPCPRAFSTCTTLLRSTCPPPPAAPRHPLQPAPTTSACLRFASPELFPQQPQSSFSASFLHIPRRSVRYPLPSCFIPYPPCCHMDVINEGGGVIGGSSLACPSSEVSLCIALVRP